LHLNVAAQWDRCYLKKSRVHTITKEKKNSQFRWFGHVYRTENKKFTMEVRMKIRGTHRQMWQDSIQNILRQNKIMQRKIKDTLRKSMPGKTTINITIFSNPNPLIP
jgi:hypothetical protein